MSVCKQCYPITNPSCLSMAAGGGGSKRSTSRTHEVITVVRNGASMGLGELASRADARCFIGVVGGGRLSGGRMLVHEGFGMRPAVASPTPLDNKQQRATDCSYYYYYTLTFVHGVHCRKLTPCFQKS